MRIGIDWDTGKARRTWVCALVLSARELVGGADKGTLDRDVTEWSVEVSRRQKTAAPINNNTNKIATEEALDSGAPTTRYPRSQYIVRRMLAAKKG